MSKVIGKIPISQTYLNLREGQVFKNYKEMCSFLEQPVGKAGNKKTQVEMFKRYFEYEKNGHKITITNVYYEPLEEPSKGAYSMLIQKLILDMLVNEYKSIGENHIIISKSRLAEKLGLIKVEYKDFLPSKKRSALSTMLNVDLAIVDEFYMMTDTKLRGYIETALSSLSQKSIINYSDDAVIVKEKDSFSGVRVASDSEISAILKCENMMLNSLMNDYDKSKTDVIKRKDVFIRGQWDKFVKGVYDNLRNFDVDYIDFYFRGYKINFSDNILNAKERMDRYVSNNRAEIKEELNALFSKKYKESYVKFNSKANIEISQMKNIDFSSLKDLSYPIKKLVMRSKDDYVEGGHLLIETTIEKNVVSNNSNQDSDEYDDDYFGIPF